MKHSSSGETQQEAYEALQIDLAFADMMLNYTFFASLVLKVSSSHTGYVKVFFLVSRVTFSLLHSFFCKHKCHSVCHFFQINQGNFSCFCVFAVLSQYSS